MNRQQANEKLGDLSIRFGLDYRTDEFRATLSPERLEEVLVAMGGDLRDACHLTAYEQAPATAAGIVWDGRAYDADTASMASPSGDLFVVVSLSDDELEDDEDGED